jgi:flagellar biosynthesis/type III secretory pathway chaperone
VPPADPFAALAREFELELLHLQQMAALLEEEQRELRAGGAARLDAITAERLVQANALELYSERRAALLGAQGFSADASGLAACAAAAGERGSGLARAWRRVAEAAGEVHDLNEQNRALLRMRLAAVTDGAAPAHGADDGQLRSNVQSGSVDAPTSDQVFRGRFSGRAR